MHALLIVPSSNCTIELGSHGSVAVLQWKRLPCKSVKYILRDYIKFPELKMGGRKNMSAYTIISNADLRHKSIAAGEALFGRNGFWSRVGNFHVDNCVKISRQGGPQAMDLTINSPPFIWLAAANGKCSCSCTHQLPTT